MDQAIHYKDIVAYESRSDGDHVDLGALAVGRRRGEALDKGREGELCGSD